MKNKFKTFVVTATLLTSTSFAAGDHGGKTEGEMNAQNGQMNMMRDMKMGADMMSKCADEVERGNPNPEQLKSCAKMMRKQADMMKSCMQKECGMMGDMMKKGEKHHHGGAK